MAKASKSDQLAVAIAKAISESAIYDFTRHGYRRVSKTLIKLRIEKDGTAPGISLEGGAWNLAFNKALDRMRHAGAAAEAYNFTKRGETESRTEITIMDGEKAKQVAADMAAGRPELDLHPQPETPVDKMAVAIAREIGSKTIHPKQAPELELINERDVENQVKPRWRSVWSAKSWTPAWERVVTYLLQEGALNQQTVLSSTNDDVQILAVADWNKLNRLIADPSPVAGEGTAEKKPQPKHMPVKETAAQRSFSGTGTIYGYARVSTPAQSLDEQVSELKKMGAQQIYSEKFTGTTVDRPEFQKLLTIVQSGDTLIVAKLDRLGRNVKEALEVMDKLQAKGVTLRIGNIGTFETNKNGDLTPMAKMMRTMMLAFAEYERDMIVERTQGGKAYAKAHDPHFREGRKPVIAGERLEQMLDYYKTHTVKETTRAFDVSKATLMRRVAENQAEKQTD
ncbi:recombinase family protein [Lacticaseibacillus hegangensis]|uniref:Recombinase family protein n=1 Tax=Lacticaseibacillus hegangensis TaxID=2486010 RepID=A0ABW4CYF9_9LACO|nr:recombinase family protein [Lacticaseibacillus hegangensis]